MGGNRIAARVGRTAGARGGPAAPGTETRWGG